MRHPPLLSYSRCLTTTTCSLYRTLITGADVATWASAAANYSTTYLSRAASLRSAINTYCWDSSAGLFKDNATDTTLHPQDANSMAILFDVVDSNSTQAASISAQLPNNWNDIGAVSPELPTNISPFISSFEIQAHFVAGHPERALELIRRSWGWYLNNPNGSQSTVIEGYLFNGSFGYRQNRGYDYDPSYVSHAHGWSSGPTSTLTNYLLGLSVTSPAGVNWRFAPQFGDLTSAEGGFVTSLGKYQASWAKNGTTYIVEYSSPNGTVGEGVFPVVADGKEATVVVDGKQLSKRQLARRSAGAVSVALEGGSHKITVG